MQNLLSWVPKTWRIRFYWYECQDLCSQTTTGDGTQKWDRIVGKRLLQSITGYHKDLERKHSITSPWLQVTKYSQYMYTRTQSHTSIGRSLHCHTPGSSITEKIAYSSPHPVPPNRTPRARTVPARAPISLLVATFTVHGREGASLLTMLLLFHNSFIHKDCLKNALYLWAINLIYI